jgi:hypothetical protein
VNRTSEIVAAGEASIQTPDRRGSPAARHLVPRWSTSYFTDNERNTGMTVALVTGANKGLGRETARRLIKEGHTVYIGARSVERGEAAAAEFGARFVQLDVTDDASVQSAIKVIEAREGHLDVLVNNAGVGAGAGVESATAESAHAVFETNVVGLVRVTQAALPLLRKSDNPVVVNNPRIAHSISRAVWRREVYACRCACFPAPCADINPPHGHGHAAKIPCHRAPCIDETWRRCSLSSRVRHICSLPQPDSRCQAARSMAGSPTIKALRDSRQYQASDKSADERRLPPGRHPDADPGWLSHRSCSPASTCACMAGVL